MRPGVDITKLHRRYAQDLRSEKKFSQKAEKRRESQKCATQETLNSSTKAGLIKQLMNSFTPVLIVVHLFIFILCEILTSHENISATNTIAGEKERVSHHHKRC